MILKKEWLRRTIERDWPAPVEVVRAKGVEIPIYYSPVAGTENYVVSYYANGTRRRDRAGTTLDAARAFAKSKVEELSKGTAHVGSLTPKQLAVVSDAVDALRETNVWLSRAARDYAEAFQGAGPATTGHKGSRALRGAPGEAEEHARSD